MRAVVLAGGQGTRLRPYTAVLPKPLMPVGDRPILDIVMRQLQRTGFERVTIATGYLAELIEVFFADGASYGLAIDYHRESDPLGTVGALADIEGLDEPFLVMNGDVLTDLDYGVLLRGHAESGAAATISVTRREVEISLGVLETEDAGEPDRVTGWREKPTVPYDASMGVYCFSPVALEYIERAVPLNLPDLVLRLVAAGERVRAARTDAYWLDIGTPSDYEQATEAFERLRGQLLPD